MFDETPILSKPNDTTVDEIERDDKRLASEEVELDLAAQQLRTVIGAIPAFAWSCLEDGSVEFLNKTWLEYTGLSQHEAAGWGG